MPYAANGIVSTDEVVGGIVISDQQYADAIQAMISGKIISIEGGMHFIDPVTEEQEPPGDPEGPQFPPITKRQLRLTLVRNNISLDGVEAAISAMPDGLSKEEAKIEWADASYFTRSHQTLLLVAFALGLTEDQVDAMWAEAAVA